MEQVFLALAVIIITAAVVGYIARLLKQPLIPAYVVTGLILGPTGLAALGGIFPSTAGLLSFFTLSNDAVIRTMSEIGIAFLLFIVGLEMDFKKIRTVSLVCSLGGTIQIAVLFGLGFFIALLLGSFKIQAVYLGLIVAFSSTAIVVKLLSDKREIDTLHGRIIIGILLMEDFFAILALSLLATIDTFTLSTFGLSMLKAGVLFGVAILMSKFIFPRMFKFAAKSQELLFMVSLAVCFIFAIAFSTIGFSIIIGAFVAGLALGNLDYSLEIISRVKPLKDFFVLIFFTSLGLQLSLSSFKTVWIALPIFIGIIILLKPFLIQLNCALFGYKKKVGFMTAVNMSQVGEFSLIIISQGMLLGHIKEEIFSLAMIIALVTITLTAYLSKYDQSLYKKFSRTLSIFDKANPIHHLEYLPDEKRYDVILCGYNRIGYSVYKALRKMKKNVLLIDFNPETIRECIKKKMHCLYGDVGDMEVIDHMNLPTAKILISTIPDFYDNKLLLKRAKTENPAINVFVTAHEVDDALKLYEMGADYVIMPHVLGGKYVSLIIDSTKKMHDLVNRKVEHIIELKRRHGYH
ncbi:cation:proton antiporter [Candidatus Woesearchaeota archaeon]|nr:cation:proton antiporter [Candidatus Woesearchaeota archaeon]